MARSPRFAASALLLAAACASGPKLPLTSAQLSARPGSAALVAYLTQPDASPDACARVPPSLPADELRDLPGPLLAAMRRGSVPPETFAGCAAGLWPSLPAASASDLTDRVLGATLDLLLSSDLETDTELQAQLAALQQVYDERPPGLAASAGSRERARQELDRLRATAPAASPAGRAAAQLLGTLRVEAGQWGGGEVDAAALQAFALAGDEAALARLARRLPGAARRSQAEEQLVRLRIARSPFPEIRQDAAGVEERVLRDGVNAVAPGSHPLRGGSLDPARLPVRQILVRQRLAAADAAAHGASLLGTSAERPAPSVLPGLPLRGALLLELEGLSGPITLCQAGRALDPTPCLAPAEVTAGPGLARVEAGAVRIQDELAPTEVEALARVGTRLETTLDVAGQQVARLDWTVRFERPADLVFTGSGPGASGPYLMVTAERLGRGRLIYIVDGPGGQAVAAVEREDAAGFHVVSHGARGEAGSDGLRGHDGTNGMDGSSATCPSSPASDGQAGSDGGPGGHGGDGGPGGDGGEIRVVVVAPAELQADTLAVIQTALQSEGGAGGPGGTGGWGGSGGRGGWGGTGTSCTSSDGHTTWLPSGSSGRNGMDGSRGSDGFPGRGGRPGQVQVEVQPDVGAAPAQETPKMRDSSNGGVASS